MTRIAESRAAGLADPLGLAVGRTTSVERALVLLARTPAVRVVVVGGATPLGGLTRLDLQRAQRVGLAGAKVSRLLVGELREVAPNTTLGKVRDALVASPAPFVVVRSTVAGVSGYIDRQMLASELGEAESWRPWPGIGPGRRGGSGRSALRERVSGVAVSALEELGRRARRSGTRACLVGGVVRDLCLNRATRDLDVVVEGDLQPLLRGFGRTRTIHERFQTATVALDDGTMLDLARARTERYSKPAALPVVSPAPIEEDLSRRDFTINALAFSLDPRRFGRVLDLHGGIEDLRRGHVRVLHGLSFIDDPTRGFRAVRLAARLGFEIEARTVALLRLALERGTLGQLSSTRLRREVECLLEAPEFPSALRLANRLGLLAAMHPGLRPSQRTRAALASAARAIAWYEALDRREPFGRWLVPLGLLLDGMEAGAARELLERISPARRQSRVLARARKGVAELLSELSRLRKASPSQIYRACRHLEVEILLMALAVAPRERVRRAIRLQLEFQRGTKLDIDGGDLLRAGVVPGPAVAVGLDAALMAKLDGSARTRTEQLRLALRAAGPPRGAA